MKCLHSDTLVHRDIKTGNILCDRNSNWKISDFGLAEIHQSSMTPRTGTEWYIAPEQDYELISFVGSKTSKKRYQSFRIQKKRRMSIKLNMNIKLWYLFFDILIREMTKWSPDDRKSINKIIRFLCRH